MGSRTTKVRKEDWRSIEKAINQLGTSKLGPSASPTYKNVYVTNSVTLQEGATIQGAVIERVADAAARLALDWYPARLCYQEDTGVLFLATTL